MDLMTWAASQLSNLLPLDEESIRQIIAYTSTLSYEQGAEHLRNLLGSEPRALEFIATFNQRRAATASSAPWTVSHNGLSSEVPKAKLHKKKKNDFNKLPALRQPEDSGDTTGAYVKKDEEDYMTGKSRAKKEQGSQEPFALHNTSDATRTSQPQSGRAAVKSTSKLPPSATGPLISDMKSTSRTSSPAPKAKTKVSITGGTAMHGQAKVLDDLDYVIRALEVQTNPTLAPSAEDNRKRRCNCMATRHPLLDPAPNCLYCGKIICVKEGLGPCTFCEKPLLSPNEITVMIQTLREERGKERMQANNTAHKRAEVASTPRAFTTPSSSAASGVASAAMEDERLAAAKMHRDKLLSFQAHNARRTRVHDEAADFETPDAGTSMWATPQERALQLKRQQKIFREQEWNARPEYEKRKVVASIDVKGGKIVRRMAVAERPQTPDSEDEETDKDLSQALPLRSAPGAFSHNPLLGKMIRPIAKIDEKGKSRQRDGAQMWRRVQDDEDDNERWILDGGVYGGRDGTQDALNEEPDCG